MKNIKLLLWTFCCGGMVLLSVLSFSPLIIPINQYEPMFAGMPLTLWAGIAVSLAMTVLTLIGALVCGGQEPTMGES